MNPSPRLAACLVAATFCIGLAHAQGAGPPSSVATRSGGPITLAAALDAAWQRAVAAREAEGQRSIADAERRVAASLWAAPPSLALSHRDDRLQSDRGARETEVGVAVPLWLPGQRAARAAVAEAAVAQADAAARLARLRLAGELRDAAWLVAGRDAEQAQAAAQDGALRQLAEDVRRRVAVGELARADALAAEAEALAADAQRLEATQAADEARVRWRTLTGQGAGPDVPAPPAGEPAAVIATDHPELLDAARRTELARQRVEFVRASHRDAPELSVGLRQDVGGRGEGSQGSLVVGLRLPFGTDDRNQPLQAAALSELSVAEASEQQLRHRIEAEVGLTRQAFASTRRQLAQERARAALLRERATLIDRSFRAGESSLPELLRALAAAADADAAATRQQAALGQAHARHEQALGRLP